MMKLYESMLVEGTSEYLVLCYSIFPVEDIDSVYNHMVYRYPNVAYFKLHESSWPYAILLSEYQLNETYKIPWMVEELMQQSFAKGNCKATVCMLDGAFCDYDDIFSSDIADQIYAFAINKNELVINIDDAVRLSDGWKTIVSEQRPNVV